MQSAYDLKERAATETPLLLFDCELRDGRTERWSTHKVRVDGSEYEPRVIRHTLFEVQTSSDQGVDAIPRVSIVLANADSYLSQLERNVGLKGARIGVRFLFYDLRNSAAVTNSIVLFQGLANPPDEITEATLRLSALNRMNLQRVLLPEVRVQRRCPWDFPKTAAQRLEAVNGGSKGRYSRFYRCGYSADIAAGVGNLDGADPFTECDFTKTQCQARGMFSSDRHGVVTRRFGGVEFVPSSIQVRSFGEKGSHAAPVNENEARYNDFVPLIYGTAWFSPSIVFARNDGNLTRMEVLLGVGEIQAVLKVLVNDIEVPVGQAGVDMTGSGWFNVMSLGNRTGNFNTDFLDSSGQPAGDPYGGMAYMSVVVPNRINDGRALPSIKVLIQGMRISQFTTVGAFIGESFTNNPVWVLLDILRRSGWRVEEIDIPSFATAAQFCDELIPMRDLHGNPVLASRFQCNLVVRSRRSAGDLVRGIRNASRLYLTYGTDGLLQVGVENAISLQQATKPAWSNSISPLGGGWPSYEFGDGTSGGFSGILRRENGEPSIRLWSRSTTDCPNRFSVEFQDSFNEYQQDSLSLLDAEDISVTGQEMTGPIGLLGIPNYDQAARILKFNLDRAIQGNTYVEFETSVKALGLRPGDIITLTYLKEGFEREPFRIVKISPNLNYQTALITAQLHRDEWYDDTNVSGLGNGGGGRHPSNVPGIPLPLIGPKTDDDGNLQFEISEKAHYQGDGGASTELTVGFVTPGPLSPTRPNIPLVSLFPRIDSESGTLGAAQTLYYAVTAVNSANQESRLSFVVRAVTPATSDTNTIILGGLSFPADAMAFHVYRGANPAQLYRIATSNPVGSEFIDYGLAVQPIAPPDPNYDHANFYWRMERQPEYAATIHTPSVIGNDALQMTTNEYRGMLVRLTQGKGAGQERSVVSNSNSELILDTPWNVEPDATSTFVVTESAWRFGAMGKNSPVQFVVPNQPGRTVQISGRAANVSDRECAAELSLITRWQIGGADRADEDAGPPSKPVFGIGISPSHPGTVELSGVGFGGTANTRQIVAGTLRLDYWDELAGLPECQLSFGIDEAATAIDLSPAGLAQPGALVQVDGEILRVNVVLNGGARYEVTRGVYGSGTSVHQAQSAVFHLQQTVAIVPFVRGFFGSPASGSWSFPVPLPNARVAGATFFVTNSKGDSPRAEIALTQTTDYGLRTLAGGQFSFQVDGFLAIQNGIAPDLFMDSARSVRDISAIVRRPPTGAPIQLRLNQNGEKYCDLNILQDEMISNTVDGFALSPLKAGARLSLDVTSVGQSNPGSDLTLTIRL